MSTINIKELPVREPAIGDKRLTVAGDNLVLTTDPNPTSEQSDWDTTTLSDPSFIKNKPTNLSDFNNDQTFIPEAPEDGGQYVRKDADWKEIVVEQIVVEQSDWDVTDTESAAYIKNNPNNSDKVSVGLNSGTTNQGTNSVAIGKDSGQSNQGTGSVAVGYNAGNISQSGTAVAVGNDAGQTSQGISAVALGKGAGRTSQGDYAIAIGDSAGDSLQGAGAIAIGLAAGVSSQEAQGVHIKTTDFDMEYLPSTKGLNFTNANGDLDFTINGEPVGGGGAGDSVAGKTGVVVLNKTDVGLPNVDNTADIDKPVSTATGTALNGKVDKDGAKVLTTNDLTDTLKTKLDGIASGAQVNEVTTTQLNAKEDGLGNPVSNGQVLTSQTDGTRSWATPASSGEANVKADWNEADNTSDAFIENKPTIPAAGDSNVQSDWNEADNTSDAFIANKPTIPVAGEVNVQSDWSEADNTSDSFIANKPTITDYSGKEDGLGNPTIGGQILSSTVAGSRSWIDAPSGGGSSVNSSFRLFEDALAHAIAVQRRAAPTMKLTSRGEVERTSADAAQVWIKPKWMLPVNTYFEFGATVEANDILSERSVRLSPITRLGINYRKGFKVMFLRQKNLTRINLVTSNSPSTPRGRVFSSVDTSSVPAPNLGTMNRVGMSYDESTGVSTVVISTDGITEESLVVDTTEDLLGWDMELGDNRPVNAVGNTTLFNFGTEPFQGGVPEGAVTLAQFPRINNWPVKLWGGLISGTLANDLLDYPLGGADNNLNLFDNQGKFSVSTTATPNRTFTEITPLVDTASGIISRQTIENVNQQEIIQEFVGDAFNVYASNNNSVISKINATVTEIHYKP